MAGRNGITQGGIGALPPVRPGPRPFGPVRPRPRPFGPDRELQPVTPPPFNVGVPVMPSPPSSVFNPPIYPARPRPRLSGPTPPPMVYPAPTILNPENGLPSDVGMYGSHQSLLDNAKRHSRRGKRRLNKKGPNNKPPPMAPPPPMEEDLPFLFLNEGGQVPRKIYDPVRMGFVDNPAYFAQPDTIEQSFGEPRELPFDPSLPSGGPNTRTPIENLYGGLGMDIDMLRQSLGMGYNPSSNIPYEMLGLTPPPPPTPNVFLPEIMQNNDSAFMLPPDLEEPATPESIYSNYQKYGQSSLPYARMTPTYMGSSGSGAGKGGKGGPVSTTVERLPGGKGGTESGSGEGLAPNQAERRYRPRFTRTGGGSATEVAPVQASYKRYGF